MFKIKKGVVIYFNEHHAEHEVLVFRIDVAPGFAIIISDE